MSENKNPEEKDPAVPAEQNKKINPEAARGKKAIEAGKIASGEQPDTKEAIGKEKKDAADWRNEG